MREGGREGVREGVREGGKEGGRGGWITPVHYFTNSILVC